MYEIDDILYAGQTANMVKVIGVKTLPNYQLMLTFSTGEKRIYDVKPLLKLPVFQPLKDLTVFNNVQLDFDTVTWCNGDVDIAPETLYHESIIISEEEMKKAYI